MSSSARLLLWVAIKSIRLCDEERTMDVPQKTLRQLLNRFGHKDFRSGQERAIRTLLDGRDLLAVFPTGAGKSLLYQFVAQLLPGITVVVSPLIALMQDQVDALRERGFNVGVINSTISPRAAAVQIQRICAGEEKLLYVTPERFEDEEFVAALRRCSV